MKTFKDIEELSCSFIKDAGKDETYDVRKKRGHEVAILISSELSSIEKSLHKQETMQLRKEALNTALLIAQDVYPSDSNNEAITTYALNTIFRLALNGKAHKTPFVAISSPIGGSLRSDPKKIYVIYNKRAEKGYGEPYGEPLVCFDEITVSSTLDMPTPKIFNLTKTKSAINSGLMFHEEPNNQQLAEFLKWGME
ncbi:MAG: hypothetical protein GY941_22585 [Planctomycetes bacterium]|nr:hypothetical protein [Planctomycetota bacterium]